MSQEFEPSLGEDGQYHFFSIVKEPGHLGKMFDDRSEEVERQKLEKFREEKRQKAQRLFEQLKIPAKYVPENCIVSLDLFGGYPDGDENLIFINKDTGLIMQEISLMGDIKEKDEGKRTYRPVVLGQYAYEEVNLEHPILGQSVSGVAVLEKSWKIDKLFRRRERYECRMTVGQMSPEWEIASAQPKRLYGALMDVEFQAEGTDEAVSVRQREQWIEKTRAFFTPEKMVIYEPSVDKSNMTLIPMKKSPFLEKDSDQTWIERIPQNLPGPETILF